jgi:transposase
MRPGRYVHKLSDTEHDALRQRYRQTAQADLRTRCQIILLSAQGYGVPEIARLTFFDADSILFWLDRYEAEGLAGLEDRPKSGRPPKRH